MTGTYTEDIMKPGAVLNGIKDSYALTRGLGGSTDPWLAQTRSNGLYVVKTGSRGIF